MTVDFVLFSTGTSLIVVILFTLILRPVLGGVGAHVPVPDVHDRARCASLRTAKSRVTPYTTVESGNTDPPEGGLTDSGRFA